MKFAVKICLFCFLFPYQLLFAQNDYTWWNEKHDWDGITPWTRYIIIAPAFMGPNALPVPAIKKGVLPDDPAFDLAFESHYSKGDQTQNLFMNLYLPLFSDKAGININLVPIEYYSMDTITRDLRRARDFDGKGISGGDFYIGTCIQLIKDKSRLPDAMISVNLKTASGTNLSAARFTDTPGYFFDLSLSKTFSLSKSWVKSFKPYTMIGFYAWQTNRDDYRQNDAYIYGIGIEADLTKFKVGTCFGGYSGYIDNGDKPCLLYTFRAHET